MTEVRRFNWEAALMPCWGLYRNVPVAAGLSVLFPIILFLSVAGLGVSDYPGFFILLLFFAAVFGAVLGLIGDAMLLKAASPVASPVPVSRRAVHALLSLILVFGMTYGFIYLAFGRQAEVPYAAQMKADLRNLVTAQEAFFADSSRYFVTIDARYFRSAEKVNVTVLHADTASFAAEARHADTAMRCRLWVGPWSDAPADTREGEPYCDPVS